MSRQLLDFRRKFPAVLSKLRLTSAEECFEVSLEKSTFRFITFAHWVKNLTIFLTESLWWDFGTATSPEEKIWEKYIFYEIYKYFFWLPDFEQTFFGPLPEDFGKLDRTAFYVYRGTFWWLFSRKMKFLFITLGFYP